MKSYSIHIFFASIYSFEMKSGLLVPDILKAVDKNLRAWDLRSQKLRPTVVEDLDPKYPVFPPFWAAWVVNVSPT